MKVSIVVFILFFCFLMCLKFFFFFPPGVSFVCNLVFCFDSSGFCQMFINNSLAFHSTPLQYSCLENPMDGGAWQAAVHEVAKSQTQLNDFTFTFLHWRRKWQPTPVFLPGESQGWGRTESDTTEVTQR